MQISALVSSLGAYSPGSMGMFNRVDVEMPTAQQAGTTSVEVSLSAAGMTALNIDMASLAAKGYKNVDIDTDGKPGAEISIGINAGAGNVTVIPGQVPVGAPDTLEMLREIIEAGDAARTLLDALAAQGIDEKDASGLLDHLLKLLAQLQADEPASDPLAALGNASSSST